MLTKVTNEMLNDLAVTESKISSGSVTSTKLADLSVTSAKLQNSSITADKIADGTITFAKIASGALSAVTVADGSITSVKLADNCVTQAKIPDGVISQFKISDGSIVTAKIFDNAVTTSKILDGAITSIKILDASISNNHISASAAISRSKIAAGSLNHVLINDGSGLISSEAQLSVSRGGTGTSTLTGYVKGNGSSAFTASSTVPRNEIANGSADHVLINSSGGALSSEAQLAKSRGGCGADMSSVTFPSSGVISTRNGTETLTNKSITKRVSALSDAASISIDASLADIFRVTIAGNRTLLNPTNLVDGQMIAIHIKQDSVGGRIISYDTMYRFSTDLPKPTLSFDPDMTDRLLFEYDASSTKLDLVAINRGYL